MNKRRTNSRTAALRKIREIKKNAMGGTESTLQRVYSEYTKTRRALKVELLGSKSKQSDTGIELIIEKFLNDNDIKFKKQKRVRYLNYDFFLYEPKVLLEINGCYWHVCPVCYPNGPKNEIQRKNLAKNDIKRKFAADAKLDLLELWEHEIEKDLLNTTNKILEAIEKCRPPKL